MSAPNTQCYNFQESGSCKFGDNCRFDHGDQAGTGATRAPRAPRQGGFRNFNNNRSNNRGPSTQECYAFAEGNCKFGDNCRFSHGPNDARAQRSAEDNTAGIERKQQAFRSQECYNFKESGNCEFGDKCKFAHGADDTRDLLQMKRRAAGTCYAWKEGNACKFGDRCRFAHENIEA